MAVIIELFGLPGSGKSFLADALLRRLKELGINALDRQTAVRLCLRRRYDGPLMAVLKKLPHAVWGRLVHEHHCLPELLNFFARHPALAALYQQELSRSGASESTIRNLLGAFAASCVERQLFECHGAADELILADEGFCHRFFTLYGNLSIVCDRDEIKQYVELLPPIQGAIFVSTSIETCIKRMQKRKRFPVLFEHCNEKQIKNILSHGHDLLSKIMIDFEKCDNISYFYYNGEDSYIENALNFICKFYKKS
jgi:hypothetical protein